MNVIINDLNKEDLIISILEDIFNDEIDLSAPTLPVPGHRSKGKARRINSMKRYACEELGVSCHLVWDSNCKYTKLKALFHEKLEEVLYEYQSCKEFSVPDKTESIAPMETERVVPPEQLAYAEMIERHNMAQEDIQALKTDHTAEEKQRIKSWAQRVGQRHKLEVAPSNPGPFTEDDITKLGFSYIFDENCELHELLYDVYEMLNDVRGSVSAKERIRIKKQNEVIAEEIKQAKEYNRKELEKYERASARIREQKQMRAEEELSIRHHIMENERRRRLAIEAHNEAEKDKYREYLKKKLEYDQAVESSKQSLDQAAEAYRRANAAPTLYPTVPDLDIQYWLCYLRDCCPVSSHSFPTHNTFIQAGAKYGCRRKTHKDFFERTFTINGSWRSSVVPDISDYIYYRSKVPELIFLMETGEVSFLGLGHQQVIDRIEELGFNGLFSNIILRIRQNLIGSRCSRNGWGKDMLMPIEQARVMVANQRSVQLPEAPTFFKPYLKKVPEPLKESTIDRKVSEKLGEPNYTSRKKLNKKLIPKLIAELDEPLPTVEEIDYMALLYGLSIVTDSVKEAKNAIKRMFGDFPAFRLHTFVNSHRKMLQTMKPVLTIMVNEWFLNINIRDRPAAMLNRAAIKHNSDKLIESKRKRREAMLKLKPKVYHLREKVILIENDIVNVQQKRLDSLRVSNDFHNGHSKEGLSIKKVYSLSVQEKKQVVQDTTLVGREEYSMYFEDLESKAEFMDPAPLSTKQRGVFSRLAIREQARRVISTIGTPCLKKIPTHMLENMFFSSAKLGFCPKLHVASRETAKFYNRKARVAFCRNTKAVRH
jgi:hypothetical protein